MIDKDLEIYEVNFAVSNVCQANCIFCPRSFVTHEKKFMSVETVERIMSEVGSWQFKANHSVVHSVMSENGEPFLNPNIIDLLKVVRGTMGAPGQKMSISLFSNFGVLTEDLAEQVISSHLIDNIHVNIDGATPESYRAVKGLNLNRVEENLKTFIKIRDAHDAPIRVLIHVISHYTYTTAVKTAYGVPAIKSNGHFFLQDGPQVMEKWSKLINPKYDAVGEDSVMFWAERYNPVKASAPLSCPNLGRVKHVAYINPEGSLYACCFDMGNDLVVGNIHEISLLEALASEKRKDLIEKLESKRFDEIGFPCNRVDSCGGMDRGMIQ